MKSLKSLIVVAALVFWACSEDTKDTTGVWVDDPAMAYGESSSSMLVVSSSSDVEGVSSSNEIPESSSAVSSSSIENKSSSSLGYGNGGITFPPYQGCKPPSPDDAVRKVVAKKAPRSVSNIVTDTSTYGVVPYITKYRYEALVAEGLPHDSAVYQVREELFKELGLDSLFEDLKYLGSYTLEYTLRYLYGSNMDDLAKDFADGKLEMENYCISELPYASLNERPYEFMPLGCAYSELDIEYPLAIMQNIWRKCAGLPYCNEDLLGEFNEDSSLVCKYKGWSVASNLDVETAGVSCDVNGKYFVSKLDPLRTYVCNEGKGWDSVATLEFEMGDVPCKKNGLLYKSELDSRVVYICRDSIVRGPSWHYTYVYETWEIATPFDREMLDIPCDEKGKIVESVVVNDSFHICRENVWDAATRMEKETRNEPCNQEGKRFESRELPGMYYVCSNGKWVEFSNLACENGDRYSTVNAIKAGYKTNYACLDGTWFSSADTAWNVPYELYFNPEIKYGSFKDPRDGHEYHTVEYQGVTWMAENLKYSGTSNTFVDTKYCASDSCRNSGYFYARDVVNQVCPDGWKLPTGEIAESLTKAGSEKSPKYASLYSLMNYSRSGYDGLDLYGLSFTATGVFNGNTYVNYDDQYFWIEVEEKWYYADEASPQIDTSYALAEISIYDIGINQRFTSENYLSAIKAPIRCIKE